MCECEKRGVVRLVDGKIELLYICLCNNGHQVITKTVHKITEQDLKPEVLAKLRR